MVTTASLSDEKNKSLWAQFVREEGLSEHQESQFERYFDLVVAWNEKIDLTAITNPADIIAYHFQDSLMIDRFVDFKTIHSLVDVGTGAGFPAIPLLIKYPESEGILLEVNKKRLSFLELVLKELDLKNAFVYDVDWRTFLRKTTFEVDLFVSRASLHTDELMRIFKPSSPYRHNQLVYWASKEWQLTPKEQPFFEKEVEYTIKNKKRRYIFFKSSEGSHGNNNQI